MSATQISPRHPDPTAHLERRSTTGQFRFSFNGLIPRRSSTGIAMADETVRDGHPDLTSPVASGSTTPITAIHPSSGPEAKPRPSLSTPTRSRNSEHPPPHPTPHRASSKPIFSLPSISFPSAGLFRAGAAVGHVHVPMSESETGHIHEKEAGHRAHGHGPVGSGGHEGKDVEKSWRQSSFIGLPIRSNSGDNLLRSSSFLGNGKDLSQPRLPRSSSSSIWSPRRSLSAGRTLRRRRGIASDPPVVVGASEAEEKAIEEMTHRLAIATVPSVEESEGVGASRTEVEGQGQGEESVSPVDISSPIEGDIKGHFDFRTGSGARASDSGGGGDVPSPLSGSPITASPIGTPASRSQTSLDLPETRPAATTSIPLPRPISSTTVQTHSDSIASTSSTLHPLPPRSKTSSTERLLTPSTTRTTSTPPSTAPSTPTIPLWKQDKASAPPVELSPKRAATLRELDDLVTGKQMDVEAAVKRIFTEDAIIEDPVVYCKNNEELVLHLNSLLKAFTSVKLLERKAMRISKPREEGDESGQCRWDQRIEYVIKGACVKKVIHSLLVVDFAPDGRIQHVRDCWNFQSLPVSHGTFSLRRSSAKLGLLGLITRRRRVFWHWETK